MGFDPMTHRPRTDFFAALPQLIALAALRDQLAADPPGSAQLQPGAGAGVDVAIQAAKLQYLQCLLQSAATTIDGIASTAAAGSTPDAEAAALCALCSPQGTQDSTAPVSAASDQLLRSCTFPEAPVSSEANQGLGYGGADVDVFTCHGGASLPPLADLSDAANNHPADGCSATASSSFGGGAGSPLPWPEFFPDDPFITDFL
jgi:transcription factor MYB, plant